MRRRGSGFRVAARSGQAQEDGGRRSTARAAATAATAAAGRRLLKEDHEFEYISEMTSDRDVETGERYPTVMAMREAKLRDWARVAVGLPFAEHVACRDFMLDPRCVRARTRVIQVVCTCVRACLCESVRAWTEKERA